MIPKEAKRAYMYDGVWRYIVVKSGAIVWSPNGEEITLRSSEPLKAVQVVNFIRGILPEKEAPT